MKWVFNPEKLNIKKADDGKNYDYLANQVKNLNLDEIDFKSEVYGTVKTKIEKSKIYFWIRVYLSEETEIEPGNDIEIKYIHSGETLIVKFIGFSKKDGQHVKFENVDSTITDYCAEDDTKCLCLIVDEEKIKYDSEDIPIIRKLFKIGRHYDHVLLRRDELILTNINNGMKLNYYDVDFS